jgi:hypothetical protein
MEENFSPQQSLLLIQSMIDKTKGNLGRNRFYFLLWGWFVFLAILLQFILKVVLHYERHYLVWLGVIPAVIITIIYTYRQNKQRGVRTYIGDSMASLWTGVGISFFVLSFIISSSKEGWMFSYPFFILLYGLGTFISGRILKFTPLIIGGVINWILACIAAYLHYDYQMLLAAIAILTSYIIPGHLLGIKKN